MSPLPHSRKKRQNKLLTIASPEPLSRRLSLELARHPELEVVLSGWRDLPVDVRKMIIGVVRGTLSLVGRV
jgi:hypothetical protein